MKNNRREDGRKLSAGTVFMLILTVVVLAGSALILIRLSSGASVDLSRLNMNVLNLQTAQPAASQEAGTGQPTEAPAATKTPQATAVPAAQNAAGQEGSFTLTVAGTVALTEEVRKNSLSQDAKEYDYSSVMMLLAPEISADVSAVFLENIYSDSYKASNTVAPEQAADLLKEAGFGMAACGYSNAWAQGTDGTDTTRMVMMERSIEPLGLREADAQNELTLVTAGGVKAAFLQYTAGMAARTRKSMESAGQSGCVPEAELSRIIAEIAEARNRGAQAVIVMINWGKTAKSPDRDQRALAEGIAQAGADLIIGGGGRQAQAAEYLPGSGGGSVLCVWNPGSLLTGDRSQIRRIAGYLFHVTIRASESGAVVLNPEYTPVYTWKYRQDSRYYYRCVAAGGTVPDGMDSDEQKNLQKAAEVIDALLKDSPLTRRGAE